MSLSPVTDAKGAIAFIIRSIYRHCWCETVGGTQFGLLYDTRYDTAATGGSFGPKIDFSGWTDRQTDGRTNGQTDNRFRGVLSFE